MDEFIERIREKSKETSAVIVLPEGDDERVRKAEEIIRKQKIARTILLNPKNLDSRKIKEYADIYYNLRGHKLASKDEAKQIVSNPVFYAAMMTRLGEADGFVAGASHTTSLVARASIQCVGVREDVGLASSCFIMIMPQCKYGEGGVFVFADCGIIPYPTSEQLSKIAILSSQVFEEVVGKEARVAFLSYSTKGSAEGTSINKVRQAVEITKKVAPQIVLDGELQADSAIVPQVAQIKCKDSPLKGKANVLIFPNLDAGNICYKLVERLAQARALGPLLMGLNKPCSDLSRGCSVDDVIDCVAITSIRVGNRQ